MRKRSGIFLVKTHAWYLERLVWLVAGVDILISSFLALSQSPNWAFSIFFAGVCSIIVALTGFCIVGNLLYLLGARPLLQERETTGGARAGSLYFMQTDTWFLERSIYLTVGINLSLSALLVRFHSPYWLLFTGFVGVATIVFCFTGFCILANMLYRLGAEPRLCRYL